jgi:hypothetical protein
MKKIILILFLFSIIFNLTAQEEKHELPYKNSIEFSSLNFIQNACFLNYERRLGKNFGLVLTGGFHYSVNQHYFSLFQSSSDEDMQYTEKGYLSEFQLRYYFLTKQKSENKWKRFFIGSYGFYRYYLINNYTDAVYRHNDETGNFTINSFGGGNVIGYNLAVGRFTLDFFTGGGLKQSNSNMDNYTETEFKDYLFSVMYTGITLKLGFNIGFCF